MRPYCGLMDPSDRKKRLRSLLAQTAPELARALGGPLAGAATQAAARILLGRGEASEAELGDAVVAASPEMLAELRLASLEFQKAILDTAAEEQRIAAEDRADARAREVALRDRIPGLLAIVILGGFFAVLGMMLTREVPAGAETEFSIMLGSLATMAAAVMNYYFGSSAGSRDKNWLLGQRGLPGDGKRS